MNINNPRQPKVGDYVKPNCSIDEFIKRHKNGNKPGQTNYEKIYHNIQNINFYLTNKEVKHNDKLYPDYCIIDHHSGHWGWIVLKSCLKSVKNKYK